MLQSLHGQLSPIHHRIPFTPASSAHLANPGCSSRAFTNDPAATRYPTPVADVCTTITRKGFLFMPR